MTVCETMEEAILRIRQVRASLLLKRGWRFRRICCKGFGWCD